MGDLERSWALYLVNVGLSSSFVLTWDVFVQELYKPTIHGDKIWTIRNRSKSYFIAVLLDNTSSRSRYFVYGIPRFMLAMGQANII